MWQCLTLQKVVRLCIYMWVNLTVVSFQYPCGLLALHSVKQDYGMDGMGWGAFPAQPRREHNAYLSARMQQHPLKRTASVQSVSSVSSGKGCCTPPEDPRSPTKPCGISAEISTRTKWTTLWFALHGISTKKKEGAKLKTLSSDCLIFNLIPISMGVVGSDAASHRLQKLDRQRFNCHDSWMWTGRRSVF